MVFGTITQHSTNTTIQIIIFRLYSVEEDSNELHLYLVLENHSGNGTLKLQRIKSGITVPMYVAQNQVPVRLSKGHNDPRFSQDILSEVRL